MNVNDIIKDCYAKGIPLKDISAQTGLTRDAIKTRAYRLNITHQSGAFSDNGKIGLEQLKEAKMREPSQQEQTRIERLLKAEGYNPTLWRLVWAHLKDEDGRKHTVLLKNPEQEKQEANLRQQFLDDIKKHAPKYPAVKYGRVKDGHLKLIDIADLHIAKYAIGRDGNVSYDVKTAVSRAHQAVEHMLANTVAWPTEKFWLPIGNDVLHIDNKNNTTTKGTRQDAQGMWWEAFRAAKKMYIGVIDRLAGIAPVEVFYNSSNHDEHQGFCLAEVLDAHYSRAKGVTFTIEPQNDRIYKQYGKNLVGFDHGDGAKDKDLPLLMACEEPLMWAECPNRYLMRHHLHHWSKREFVAAKDMPGVTLSYMRSPSAADAWHAKQGYVGAPQAIDSYVFHPENGMFGPIPCVFAR